tara:strand:+ start:5788 stop:6444 length:657 start_codon:yes stop_codon:yes gene_type:complete
MTYSNIFTSKDLRYDSNGLIPAIAQDWLDGTILMLAWMNQESLEKTLKTKEVYYWSRSRSELWKKGATSGNIQSLKGIRYDCDNDSILLSINQHGEGACHTGEKSCFFNEIVQSESNQKEKTSIPRSNICTELFNTLQQRSTTPQKGSYTNQLLVKGSNTILKKIGEESAEFIMACMDNERNSIASEAADLIYHLQVALLHKGVNWRDVLDVLDSRRK